MNKRHSVKRRLPVASCTSIFMALTLMLWVSYQVVEGTLDRVKKENMQLMVEDTAVSMKKALSAVRDNVIRLEANAEELEQVSGAIIERSSAINIAMEEAATGNSDQAGSIAVVSSNMEELGENINRVNSCIEEISRIADQTEEIVVSTEVLNELKASLEEVMITFESFLKESTDMCSQIEEQIARFQID